LSGRDFALNVRIPDDRDLRSLRTSLQPFGNSGVWKSVEFRNIRFDVENGRLIDQVHMRQQHGALLNLFDAR